MGGILSKGEQILRKALEAAIDEAVKQVVKKGENEVGQDIEFRPEDLQQLSNFYDLMRMASKKKLSHAVMKVLLREYVLHAQSLIVQPSQFDTSHNYRTWCLLTEFNYYARTLGEAEQQYETKVSKEDKERIEKEYLRLYDRLKIQDTDSEDVKKEKQILIDQIPHTVLIGEALFTRPKPDYPLDVTTNFFLPCFGQWFVEQAFKTGPYIDAEIGIESMTPEEFKQQWGNNRIDLSNLYGGNPKITSALRSKKDGKLKVQKIKIDGFECDFPPKLVFDVELKDLKDDEVRQEDVRMYLNGMSKEDASKKLYALGHPRFNLHFGLVFIQTLWIREHNDVCDMLKKNNPDWNDERIFQTARLICIAELSKVVIEDYIKHIMNYSFTLEFDPSVTWDSSFQYTEHANYEFNFLYRWHSLVPTDIYINKEKKDYGSILFEPHIVQERGMNGMAEDLIKTNASRLGLKNTPDFLKYLEITTLLHSRVLKTRTYNEYRVHFGLKKATSFSDITKDKDVQKKLEELYERPDNVDWYVGILAEDHLGDGMMGPLMQMQIGIYAFAAIFSNPICSKLIYNEKTFTKEGMARINSTRLSQMINRNSQETGLKPIINPENNPDFDCFTSNRKIFSPAYGLSTEQKAQRELEIEKSQKEWPIDQNAKPWHLDDKHINVQFVANTMIQKHSLVLAKNQLKTFFLTLFSSLKTHSFLSTFKTQVAVIKSVLSSPSKYMSPEETTSFIQSVDSIVTNVQESNDLIDNTYGEISRIFSKFQSDHLKNFKWNKDSTFGELILNGLDPTQVRNLTEQQLKTDTWKDFVTPCTTYLKTHQVDFLTEVKSGNIYYLDNFETMNLIKKNNNIARPRAIFRWSQKNSKFYPVAIQLNDKTKSTVKVKVVSGKDLPKMDLLGKTDTYVEVYCGKQKQTTSTKWFTYNPEWNQEFEFSCDHEDVVKFIVLDNDVITSEEMARFEINIKDLSEETTKFDMKVGEKGSIQIEIQHFHPHTNMEKRIYTRDNNNWSIAKLFVGNAFVVHHEIISHNLKCHSLMEAVAICMHHTLFEKHPVFAILSPHLYYTDVINLLARKTLMKDDGSGLVSQLFSCGYEGYTLNDYFWDKFDFSKYIFIDNLKERNINIDRYYYAKDGMKLWNATEKYVTSILTESYKDGDLKNDYELQNFIKMLTSAVKGMIKVEKLSDLIKLLTALLFNSTSNHTSLHYSQLDQLSFAPLLPTYMNDSPPPFDDSSFGEVGDNGELTAKQQKKMLRYLPTMGQAIMINSTFEPVTKVPLDTPLLSDDYNLFKSEPYLSHFKQWQSEIKKISDEILNDESRKGVNSNNLNQKMNKYPYMGRVSRSINF